jgi:hypothetical protein
MEIGGPSISSNYSQPNDDFTTTTTITTTNNTTTIATATTTTETTIKTTIRNNTDSEITNTTLCENRFMCTRNNLTWIPKYHNVIFDHKTACKALIDKGIKKILFYGDSFMRHIYGGMLISLNGDYKGGSLANLTTSSECAYHNQFEKRCVHALNHYGSVCDGKVHLDPLLTESDFRFSALNDCSSKGTVALWSFGNHKLGSNRYGVNNATAHSEIFTKEPCPKIKERDQLKLEKEKLILERDHVKREEVNNCSIWWVSTHYRMKAWFGDESPEIIKDYNIGMRKFMDSGQCGEVNYIDVYNMTARLILNHPDEGSHMTFDKVHWGIEVNLLKAQIILNALMV